MVPPGALHQRVERCRRLAALLASKIQVVFPSDCDGPQKSLDDIIVYLNSSVVGVTDEAGPPIT
jgi:hypothetical protein